MQSTPNAPPYAERPNEELIEDLCLALRDVGVGAYSLPDGHRVEVAIKKVQEIHSLLNERGVDLRNRLERLGSETNWQMGKLLADCLSYPEVVPYVRAEDGVRTVFRCIICFAREYPDRESIWLCDECLAQAKESIDTRIPVKGLLLLRLYNNEYWCKHADAETVLIGIEDYEPITTYYCKRCITEEQEGRARPT